MDSSTLYTVASMFVIALGMLWQLNHMMTKVFTEQRTKIKADMAEMEGRLRDAIRNIGRPVAQQDRTHPRPNPNHRGPTPRGNPGRCPRR